MNLLEFANNYFSKRLHTEAWTGASEEERLRGLSWATLIIQGAFDFADGVFTITSEGELQTCSQLKSAVCEQALWLLKQDVSEYPAELMLGIAQATA